MVLDSSLLNTQHYKVRFKGKVEQSRERNSALSHLGVVAIEKEVFGSPSNKAKDVNLSGTTTPGMSEPGSNGYEGVLHIPLTSRTEVSPSDGLVLYSGHWLWRGLSSLQRSSRSISQPQSTGP